MLLFSHTLGKIAAAATEVGDDIVLISPESGSPRTSTFPSQKRLENGKVFVAVLTKGFSVLARNSANYRGDRDQDVRKWHFADIDANAVHVRSWG